MPSKYTSWVLWYLLMGITCCTGAGQVYESPPGYDLTNPEKFTLPESLLEISGIAFHQDSIWGINDEQGIIHGFVPGERPIRRIKFGSSGDYEDLSIYQQTVFILRSDGSLFTTSLPGSEKENKYENLLPKGEYEGLFVDKKKQLYVLCKECRKENDYEAKGYILSTQSRKPVVTGDFTINSEAIYAKIDPKKKFRPSGLTQHPETHDWYMISSVNKVLLIADSSWQVKDTYPLDPALFRQPEGITFDEDNNLYICNEGDKLASANLLKFVFNPDLQ